MTFIALFLMALTGHIIFGGYVGQVLLCQASFMGIGAYTTGILTVRYHMVPIVGVVAGVLATCLITYLLGKIILRLTRWYLSMATLSVALITDSILGGWINVTGGPSGLRDISNFSIGGLAFGSVESFYILAWILALAGWVFALHLGSSRVGRAFAAINRDEAAASALGINVAKYKLQALVLCGAYSGLSGALYVHFIGIALPDTFGLFVSFEMLMAAILGGLGTIYGVFLSAPLLKFLPDIYAFAGNYKEIIFGLLFIVIPMYFAGGISGIVLGIWHRLSKFLPPTSGHNDLKMEKINPE
jgi:branched-chain amino acid transport system permease protein